MKLLPWIAAVLSAVLLGCGPGLGGTGTGESGEFLPDFGAVAQPVCGAPFAPRLDCDGVNPPGGPAPGSGTAALTAVDVAGGGRIVVVFDGNAVALDAVCIGIAFNGVWGTTPAGEAQFYGGLLVPGQAERSAASLAVETVAGSTNGDLRITLRAVDGSVVLGPLVVRPVPVPLAPIDCP